MNLMTKSIEKQIPPLYSQDGMGEDAIVYVKFFDIMSNWTWFGMEYDAEHKMFFGLVLGFELEMGYFSLSELESFGFGIERDVYFKPQTLRSVKNEYV